MAKRSWFGPLHIQTDDDKVFVSSVNNDLSFEIPRQVIPQLSLLLKNALEDDLESRLSSPGKQLMSANNSEYTGHGLDLVNNFVETINPGQNKSASKWILHFLAENKDRPQLILAALCELKARNLSADEFFMAYIYSNTDNIQANLHFADYLRISWGKEQESHDTIAESEAQGFIQALINNSTLRGLDSESELWRLLSSNCKDWTNDDLLCLTLIFNEIHSFRSFERLLALAGTARPTGLFHYLRCLTYSQNSDWLAIALWESKTLPDSFADRLKLIEIFRAYLYDQPVDNQYRLRATALTNTLKLLPLKFDEFRARFLLRNCDLSLRDLTEKLIDDLHKAFHFEISRNDISQILGERLATSINKC